MAGDAAAIGIGRLEATVAWTEDLAATIGPLASAAIALVLARDTLLPGVAFWDTGEFQTVPPLLGTLHPTGFPAYALLGWFASVVLQPFGEPALRMNLFGAICVAAAIGFTTVLVRQLTDRPILAAAAGLVLFLSPITWDIATHADAHSLHLALLGLLLVLLVGWEERVRAVDGPASGADRWLIAAAAVYGVALANHTLAVLAAPGIGLFVLAVEPRILVRRGLVARCVATFAVVLVGLYLELPLRAGPFRAPIVYGHPETLAGFAYVVFAQQFTGDLVAPLADLPAKFRTLLDLGVAQLGPTTILVPIGLAAAVVRRPRFVVLTLPTVVLTCLFAVSYRNADISRYYLGPLLILVAWLSMGAALVPAAAQQLARRVLRGRPDPLRLAVVAGFAAEVAAAAALAWPASAAAPAVAARVDERSDTIAAVWLDTVLTRLKPNAVVISWWSYSTPLWYARDVEGRRPDITIIDDRTRLDENLGDVSSVIDRYLGRRPVYVIRLPAEKAALEAHYRLAAVPDPTGSGLAEVVARIPAQP